MRKITGGKDITRSPLFSDIYEGVSYVVSNDYCNWVAHLHVSSGYEYLSDIQDYVPKNWKYGEPVKTLLVHISSRLGDNLWLTALIHKIKKLLPNVEIDVLAGEESGFIYKDNKDIRGVHIPPLPYEAIKAYDGILFLENLVANRKDVFQPNCYSILFEEAGVPFEPADGKPIINLKYKDWEDAYQRLHVGQTGEIVPTFGHIVVNLNTSGITRNLKATQWIELVTTLSKGNPQSHIYGLSSGESGGVIQNKLIELGLPNYTGIQAPRLNLAHIACIIRYAQIVITPDTGILHLAAAFDVPTVAIMTTVPPMQRVGTYPYCVPIWNVEACPYAPCFHKRETFHYKFGHEVDIAPCYTPNRYTCDVATSVTTKQIFEAINKAVKIKLDSGGYDMQILKI